MTPHDCHRSGSAIPTAARLLLFVLSIAGCGVDSGGTGATQTSSYANGPITGFGSVIVQGVHFDDSRASVTDADGNAHNRSDLKLGMTTEIRGSPVTTAGTLSISVATSVVFGSAIVGPIDTIDSLARTMVVFGQSVAVTPTTVIDNSIAGGLGALAVSDVIEVYALLDAASGSYNATRIDRKAGAVVYQLRGIVANLDPAARTFNIGGRTISYANLPASQVPTTLANARLVRVQIQTSATGGVWFATALQDSAPVLQNQAATLLEGLITKFTSSSQFTVNGVNVDASHASFPNGTGGLGLGARVVIGGSAAGNVLVASTVQVKTEAEVMTEGFELDGAILSIDTTNRNFVLFGVTVNYADSVPCVGGTIADLAAGKVVEVTGTLSTDGTQLQAVRIVF